jgi:cytoskeletal protein CcmA (bactofilin family)
MTPRIRCSRLLCQRTLSLAPAQKPAHLCVIVVGQRARQRGISVAGQQGVLVIREDTILKGEIRNCRQMEVYGYVEGDVAAESLVIHSSGQCYGTVKIESAEIHGTLQGDVVVKHLISIRDTGSVSGNVQYGTLAMEAGGSLTAEVRNVPPKVAGDLDVTVDRGRSVRITLEDLHAIDPDDDAKDLIFTVSNARNGFVALSGMPGRPAAKFTQADLEGGRVNFAHDGTAAGTASFDVFVADHTGATSGRPQTVKVTVRGG